MAHKVASRTQSIPWLLRKLLDVEEDELLYTFDGTLASSCHYISPEGEAEQSIYRAAGKPASITLGIQEPHGSRGKHAFSVNH